MSQGKAHPGLGRWNPTPALPTRLGHRSCQEDGALAASAVGGPVGQPGSRDRAAKGSEAGSRRLGNGDVSAGSPTFSEGKKYSHRWVWPGPSAGTRQDTGLLSVGKCVHSLLEAARATSALCPSAGLHLRKVQRAGAAGGHHSLPQTSVQRKIQRQAPAKGTLRECGPLAPRRGAERE